MRQQALTIDEVIEEIDSIIEWARITESPLGYFPALYRKVTLRIKQGIADNYFENGERMEQLDIMFANRYLEAFELYKTGEGTTQSWMVAFETSQNNRLIVLQHLLLGINAHINLDLAIAAARTSPAEEIHDLKNDFDKINTILASLVDEVERELAEVWPMLKLLDWIAGKTDEALINFSINIARIRAWKVAKDLAYSPLNEQDSQINHLDHNIAKLGAKISRPSFLIRVVIGLIKLGERGSVRKIIDILM